MKNKLSFLIVLVISLVLVLGCGISERIQKAVEGNNATKAGGSGSGNKSLQDKAIESAVGEKIGIAECDEVMDFFTEQAKGKDEDFIAKATKELIFSKIKDEFKKSIEQNKTDKVQLAKDCKMYLDQLKKYQAEEKEKSQQ